MSNSQPFVLDVDAGTTTLLGAVPADRQQLVSVSGVGGRAAVTIVQSRREPDWQLFGLRGREPQVSSLGTGRAMAPAGDGAGVWVKSVVDSSHCTLREVGVDGRELRAPEPFACEATIASGGALGLVVNRTHVLDPLTGRTVLGTQ